MKHYNFINKYILPGRKLKRFLMDKNSLHRTKLGELSFNAFYFSFCYADLPHVRLVNAARCRRHSMPNQGIAMFDQFNPHGGVKDFLLLLLFDLFIPFFAFFVFSFWLTKLPKTKIGCVIFCTMFTVCKARQARKK